MAIVFGHKIHIIISKFGQNSIFYSQKCLWGGHLVALAVRVEEGEDARGGRLGSLDTRPHQPLPLVVAENSDLLDCSKFLTVGSCNIKFGLWRKTC